MLSLLYRPTFSQLQLIIFTKPIPHVWASPIRYFIPQSCSSLLNICLAWFSSFLPNTSTLIILLWAHMDGQLLIMKLVSARRREYAHLTPCVCIQQMFTRSAQVGADPHSIDTSPEGTIKKELQTPPCKRFSHCKTQVTTKYYTQKQYFPVPLAIYVSTSFRFVLTGRWQFRVLVFTLSKPYFIGIRKYKINHSPIRCLCQFFIPDLAVSFVPYFPK